MSKDKDRAAARRMRLLRWAHDCAETGRGLLIHCEFGMALANPDLQRLLRDGLLRLNRRPKYPPGKGRIHGGGTIQVTELVITPAGRAAVGRPPRPLQMQHLHPDCRPMLEDSLVRWAPRREAARRALSEARRRFAMLRT